MSSLPPGAASWTGSAWSSTVRLVVTDARALPPATGDLIALLGRVDAAASRFRADSQLSVANALAGRPVAVSRLLVDLVEAALEAAARTSGAVDPTVGLAMNNIGYDRDIAEIAQIGESAGIAAGSGCAASGARDADDDTFASPVPQAGGWQRVRVYREAGLLTVPFGHRLDLGATAKAWTADHAASTLAQRYGTGVLVELGGDLAVAGPAPEGGWRVRVAEREGDAGQVVVLQHGGLATSTTTVRRWTAAGRPMHHIVDPATGLPAEGPWRTVTVHASSALAANVASTDALVRGTCNGLAARMVDQAGAVTARGGWPPPPTVTPCAGNVAPGSPVVAPRQEDLIGTTAGTSR